MNQTGHSNPSKTGELFWGPAGLCKFLILPEHTQNSCVILQVEVAPKAGAPVHTHTNEDETLYVVEGECTVRVGDDVIIVPPGHSANLPRGIEHRFWNNKMATLRVILMFSPTGIEGFLDEVSQPLLDGSKLDKPAMLKSLLTVGPRYGIGFKVD